MKPNTRKEAFLMKHMGFDVETPEPATREEMIMANAPVVGASGGCGWVERKEVTVECGASYDNALDGFQAFAIGDTVTVKVDGIVYSLVAFEDSSSGFPVIGDKPEYVMTGEGGEYGWFIGLTPEATLFCTTQNCTVSYFVDVVHKIDGKFMPEGYPYSTEETFEESRYFTPSGPDGGFVNDLEFAKLLQGNLDKATYTYNDVDVVEPNFVTLQDTFAYIETRIGTRTQGFMVQLRTDSNGNLTGQVWFGNDHFSNGSITINGVKETIHKMDPKFLPDGTEVVYLQNAAGGLNEVSKLAEISFDERGRLLPENPVNWPDVSRELADELFKKWVAGKVRIFVLSDTSLGMGGTNCMHEVLSMHQVAQDSSGSTWYIKAMVVKDTAVKEIKIA